MPKITEAVGREMDRIIGIIDRQYSLDGFPNSWTAQDFATLGEAKSMRKAAAALAALAEDGSLTVAREGRTLLYTLKHL